MKKFLTSVAVAALALPAFAAMSNYTVSPTPGDVTALDGIAIEFPDYDELEINSRDDIQFTCKGAEYTGYVNKGYSGNVLNVTFRPAITDPGEYTLTLLPGCITGCEYTNEQFDDLEEKITVTYTIPDGGVSGGGDFAYVCNPAEGTVDEISVVTVTFTNFDEIEFLSKSDIMAIFKGEQISCKIENKPIYSNNIRFTFDPAITESGHLELYIPAGSICGYADENMFGDYDTMKDLDDDLSINFTIGSPSAGPDFSFTANPAAGKVNELANVELTFAGLSTLELEGTVNVTLDGTALAADAFNASAEGNILKVEFTPALEGEGEVVISVPAEALKGIADDVEGKNEKEIKLTFSLQPKAEPVVYDLVITTGTPKFKTDSNDGVIDPETNIEMFTFRSPVFGLLPKTGAKCTLVSEDGSYEYAMNLQFGMQNNDKIFGIFTQFKALMPNAAKPKYDGTYYIVIPKGSFGDEAWIANPETGRSNDEIRLEYIFEGFGQPAGLQYTLTPIEVDPAAETTVTSLETITLTFDERVYSNTVCQAVLSNTENRYSEEATVTVRGKVATLTFANAPTLYGNYTLTITKGSIVNNDYAEDPDTGKLTPELSYIWTFDPKVGVETVNAAAAEAPVYNLQGIKVADSLENLPAGLYIQSGRKVSVK